MKYVFFGTAEFSRIILDEAIARGLPPSLVVCNPDRPVGRKKILTPPPVKTLAEKKSIAVWQPEKLDNHSLLATYDFAVVAAYAKIIPKSVLDAFPKGVIGVHPSLLPKYRGPSPIQQAILDGEKKTGITLYLMDEKIDHGKIIAEASCPLARNDTYQMALQNLAELAGKIVAETIPKFFLGDVKPVAQDEKKATYTRKFSSADAFVEDRDLAEAQGGAQPEKAASIYRTILALNPEPGVWTLQNGIRTKLLQAELKNGRLVLVKIQKAGETPRGAA